MTKLPINRAFCILQKSLEGEQKELVDICQNEAIRLTFSHVIDDPLEEHPKRFTHLYSDNEVLFEKQFQTQTAPVLSQKSRIYGPTWVTTPAGHQAGETNLLPVYCFGGYYKARATPLESITQSYFIITHRRQKTVQQLQTCGLWREHSCPPKQGGVLGDGKRVVFVDSDTTPQSLADDIREGQLTFTVSQDDIEHTYESFDFQQQNILSNFVDILLKLKGEV